MKNAPSPDALNRIVRWVVLLFLAYALLAGPFHLHTPEKPSAPQPVAGSVAVRETRVSKDCGTENGLNNFSLLAASLLPSTQPAMRMHDIKAGTGEAAACGQTATLRYEYALENGTVIYSNLNSQDSVEETLGAQKMLRGLELGVLGMRPGGERKVLFPAPLAFGRVKDVHTLLNADQFAVKADKLSRSVIAAKISLIGLSPKLPSNSMPLRVIDHKFGGGPRAQCGDTVQAEMTVWKVDGTKVFSTSDAGKPLMFTIGASQVPFGIEQAAIDMTGDSERTVILPAAYVKPLVESSDDSGAAAERPLAKLPGETLLLEIRLKHIGDDQAAMTPMGGKAANPPAKK